MVYTDKLKGLRDECRDLKWVPLWEMTKIPFCMILQIFWSKMQEMMQMALRVQERKFYKENMMKNMI